MLLDWLDEASLDRVGCFRYEPVRGATSNDLAAPVPKEVIEERWHRFMAHQQAISKKRLKRNVGSRQEIIIDEVGPTVSKGRSKGDAPEIDGAVYVKSKRSLRVGEFATVKIERADDMICTEQRSDSDPTLASLRLESLAPPSLASARRQFASRRRGNPRC